MGSPTIIAHEEQDKFLQAEDDADEILGTFGITKPPVPTGVIKKVFPDCTLDVLHFSDEAFGFTYPFRGQWHILIDSEIPLGARRLTAFHEFYHMLKHEVGFNKEGLQTDFKHSEANFFAVCLLMPARWFRKHWEQCEDVDIMAEIFGVTKTAVQYRLMGLEHYLAA